MIPARCTPRLHVHLAMHSWECLEQGSAGFLLGARHSNLQPTVQQAVRLFGVCLSVDLLVCRSSALQNVEQAVQRAVPSKPSLAYCSKSSSRSAGILGADCKLQRSKLQTKEEQAGYANHRAASFTARRTACCTTPSA